VNTGDVVLRAIHKDDLRTEYLPVGHSTHLAARMESLARGGTIVISEHTYKLTEGYFAFKALGQTKVKGLTEPIDSYEVLGAGPLRTRLQVAARRGLTRFVGRHTELDQLQRVLEQAKAGHGQIVGVMGEPGVGKSRLFYEFKLISQRGCLVLEAVSVSYGKASPYLPVIELLKTYFQIQLQDDERSRRERVIGKVLGLDRSLEDTLPYLFALLGIEEQTSALQQMDAQIRRRRTFDALKRLFLRESLNQPLILIFEDLHWIDSETQGFLDTLSESVASARILLLTNYRPEYRHEWGQKTYYTQLRLAPLGKEEAEEFLTELLGATAVGTTHASPLQALKQLILEKTEGTPFFMEEVVQTLAEEGVLVGERGHYRITQHAPTLQVPTTVQGVLTARIDRLSPTEKAFLHQLAIIGRQFPLSLIQRVVAQPEEDVYRLLAALQAKEFLYEQPAFPEPEYIFKHALTQEVAYGTVLQDRRKALHERTAQAIEEVYHTKLEDHYGELAHHYSRSGNTQKAVDYLQLAGQQTVQRSANKEAVNHLTTALELLKALPDTPKRTQQELALQLALGAPLIATKGWAASEIETSYTRARELCQQVGETSQLFSVLSVLSAFYLVRAELQTARELGEQLLSLAQSVQDSALLVEAHHVMGITLLSLGNFALGREHSEQGSALYDPQQHGSLAFIYGQDPGVFCRANAAFTRWLLGYPDQASAGSREALTLAQRLSHPFSLAYALQMAAILHQVRREGQAVQERAEAQIALAREQGFPDWLAWGTIWRGWALAAQGQGAEGIAQIRQGQTSWQALGAEIMQPYCLALLAEAYGKGGQVEEGLSVLAEALALMDKTQERWYEAELYRLKGELSLQSRSPKSEVTNIQHPAPSTQAEVEQEAEECFHKAIEIARRQQAKSLELRAVMSLVRLRQHQATQPDSRTTQHEARTMLDAARNMLSDIYNWFTEGFDTKDLQEAKALLDQSV
jgi:predicted ATPase